jgi:hypothetical protein
LRGDITTTGGILLGVSAEKMLHEAQVRGWLAQGLLLVVGIAAPLLSGRALMLERPLPAFLNCWGARRPTQPVMTRILGFT